MSVPGSRVNVSAAGCACGVPARAILPGQPGEKRGRDPAGENSLASLNASLTNSLGHPHQIGVTRPVVRSV
jgi:hypothetical protein